MFDSFQIDSWLARLLSIFLCKVPSKVLQKLESIRNGFFWGGNSEKRKITWVSWSKTINEMEKAGLSIDNLKDFNLGPAH